MLVVFAFVAGGVFELPGGEGGEEEVGVWLEGGEGDLVAVFGGGEEVFEAKVELGCGDFLAAFLFVGGGEFFAEFGEDDLGFFDGGEELGAAFGFFCEGLFQVFRFDFGVLCLGGEGEAFIGCGLDAGGEVFDFRFAADGDFTELGEACLHGALLFLCGLFGAFLDG